MKLIVGLGNPGQKFEDTRHNIGFMVLEKLARDLTMGEVVWKEDAKHKALLYQKGDVLFVKPLTFMNNVGITVASLVNFYKLKPDDVWVVHDDIDLPMGKIRIREKGGSAGHHGVDSIIAHLKSYAFVRFRLGVGRGMSGEARSSSVISYVLSRFRRGEAGDLKHLVKRAVEAVGIALHQGLDKAMNRYH